MKFNPKNIVLLIAMFLLVFNVAINAQNDDNQVDDQTNEEQPKNDEKNPPQDGEKSEDEGDESEDDVEKSEDDSEKQPSNELEKLASDDGKIVAATLDQLSADLSKSLDTLISGLNHSNVKVREHCVDLLLTATDHKDKVIEIFVSALKSEDDVNVMKKMMGALITWEALVAEAEFLKLLNHEIPAVRMEAINGLVTLKKEKALDTLFAALQTENYPDVKATIYEKISKQGSDEQLAKLLLQAEKLDFSQEKDKVLNEIIACAAKYQKQIGTDILVRIAQNSQSSSVRLQALKKVLPLVNRDNIGILVSFLWDEDLDVRQTAFDKLSEATGQTFGYNSQADLASRVPSIGEWQKWKNIDELVYWLNSEETEDAEDAYNKILEYGISSSSVLIKSYDKASDAGKERIIRLLGNYPTPEALKVVAKGLNSNNTEIKKASIANTFKAWKKLQDSQVLVPLQKLFDASAEKDLSLAFKLADAKHKSAVDFVQKTLKDASSVEKAIHYTTPDFYEALASHVAQKNAISKKIVEYLLQEDNSQASSALVGHFSALEVADKITLLYQVQSQKFTDLVAAFSAEKSNEVLIAFCDKLPKNHLASYVDGLVKKYSEVTDENTKKSLLNTVAKANNNTVKSFLVKTSQEEKNNELQLLALNQYLNLLGDKKASYATERLAKEENAAVRAKLYEVNGDFTKLKEALSKEKDVAVKKAILGCLHRLNASDSQKLLLDILSQEGSAELKKLALSLIDEKGEKVSEKLVNAYSKAKDASVENAILKKLSVVEQAKAAELAQKRLAKGVDVEAFSILVKTNAEEAKKQFPALLEKSTTEQKIAIVNASSAVMGKEHVAILLPFIINDESQELFNAAKSALDKIMGSEIKAEELSAWNENYQRVVKNLNTALTSDKKEDVAAAKKALANHKEITTKEIVESHSANLKAVKILGEWQTPETARFFEGLTGNNDSALRKASYKFLANDPSFAKDATTLYLLELNPSAKTELLKILLKAYPNAYRSDLKKHIQNVENKDAISTLIKEHADSKLVAELFKDANKNLQVALLSIIAENTNAHNLRTLAEKIVDGNEEEAKPFLAVLKNYSVVVEKAKSSRKEFVAWWLDYKKELTDQENIYTVLEKLASSDILEQKNARKELESLKIKDSDLEKYLSDKEVSNDGKKGLLSFLSQSPSEEQISLFSRYLEDENESLKLIAVDAITKIGYSKAPNVISKLAKSDSAKVRFAAIQAIGKSSKEDAADVLRANLGDVDFRVREEAYYWLLERQEALKETSLEMFASNQPLNIQNMAIDHLKSLGEDSIIPKLITHLNNPFEEMRTSAYSALVSLSGKDFTFDAKADERQEAIDTWNSWWVEHKKQQEISKLVTSLSDPQANISEVKKRIVSFGPEAAKLVEQELQSPIGIVRRYAVEIFSEMKRRDMSIEIAKLLSDSDINVRIAAKNAVESLSGNEIKDLSIDTKNEGEWQKSVATINKWWSEQQQKLQEKQQGDLQATKKKVDELLVSLTNEKTDRAKVIKEIVALGSSATSFVEKQLANDNNQIVIGAIETLALSDAKQSVEQIILLLQKETTRKSAEAALKKLVGDLPIESVESIQREQQVKNLQGWWEAKREQLKDNISDVIDKVTEELEANSDIEAGAKKLVALKDHSVIEDYLADKRLVVKQAIITALIEFGSKDSVKALQPYLSGTDESERKLVISAIRAITGEAFAPQVPKDEKEWDQVNAKVEDWVKNWNIQKQESLRSVEADLKKSVADNKVAETVKKLQELGKDAASSAKSLLSSKDSKEQLAVLDLIIAVSSQDNMSEVIALVGDENKEVRTKATSALEIVSGEKLPQLPDQEQVWGIQIAKLQSFWKQKQQESIDTTALMGTLKEVASDISDDDAKNALKKYGNNVISAISPLLVHEQDHVRLGAVKALALIGDFNQGISVATTLSDSHLKVREEGYNLLSRWAESKPQVVFSPQGEDKWQTKVDDWFAKWQENEQKAQSESLGKSLDADAAKIKDLSNLWTQEQVDQTRKVVEYLQSPIKQIRDKAADIINDGPAQEAAKDESVQYNDEAASKEEIDDNYREYAEWLDKAEKNLSTLQEEVQELLDDLDKQKEDLSGAINSLDDYEDVRDIIGEMSDKTNPKVLKKYSELLEKYGCDISKFDPYAGEEQRLDQLYEIEKSIYPLKRELENQADTSEEVLEQIEDKLDVKEANTLESLSKIESLVLALGKDIDYDLRKNIAEALKRATDDLQGYNASASKEERNTALQSWNEWLVERKQSIEEQQKKLAKKIEDAAKSLEEKKQVTTIEEIATAQLLVDALSGAQSKIALDALKVANDGKEASDWNQWLVAKKKVVEDNKNLQNAISSVSNMANAAGNSTEAAAINFLVQNLSNSSEEVRISAFKALEAYSTKYAQNQVREGFGYDPKAPVDKLEKPIADWKKWYSENVEVLLHSEEEKLRSALQLGKTLLNNDFANARGLSAATELVDGLRSDSLTIREASIAALQGYTKNNYGYDATAPEKQSNALKLWDSWLAYNKTNLLEKLYSRYLETNLSSRQARTRALEMIAILKGKKPAPELSNIAISWLRRETSKDLVWSDNIEERTKTLNEIDAWFKKQEPLYRIDSIASGLKGGVTTILDLQNAKLLIDYLDSAEESTRAKAISELNKVTNNIFDWNAKAEKDKRDLAKKDIDAWLAEQEVVVPLRDQAAVLKSKEDVNRDNIKGLIEALSNSYSSARKIAADALSPYFPENVNYKYDSSEKDREKALEEITSWYEELE
ncbi:HEAT repeat domain-containing protein [Candidatus Uabimicrobium sp. HlEnr_7]|uniref:HEAT repeat domain-containing protein n=1 Tax=Candidatus Uabimicrobium helgolandensis TaxID=3095367 RepID=UPI003559136C